MDTARDRRKQQLETLRKTVNGQERIVDAYRRVCLPPGAHRPLSKSFKDMIEEILEAEFGPDLTPGT